MTTPPYDEIVSELVDQAPTFASRTDIEERVGLIARMLRYFQGNPVKYFQVSSVNSATPTVLPDDPRARSAYCVVLGAPIIYRTDGTNPTPALDQTLPVNSIITLTGFESIKGFVFAAAAAVQATLTVNYYD